MMQMKNAQLTSQVCQKYEYEYEYEYEYKYKCSAHQPGLPKLCSSLTMFDEELPTPLSDAADNQDKDDGDDDVHGDDQYIIIIIRTTTVHTLAGADY